MNEKVYQKLARTMDIPSDLSCKSEIVEISGNTEIRIENYQSIVEYSEEKLLLRCNGHLLEIRGQNLVIAFFDHTELLLKGSICQLNYL